MSETTDTPNTVDVNEPDKLIEHMDGVLEEAHKDPTHFAAVFPKYFAKMRGLGAPPPEGESEGEINDARKGVIFWIATTWRRSWRRLVQFSQNQDGVLRRVIWGLTLVAFIGGMGIAVGAFVQYLFTVNIILAYSVLGALVVEIALIIVSMVSSTFAEGLRSNPKAAAAVL